MGPSAQRYIISTLFSSLCQRRTDAETFCPESDGMVLPATLCSIFKTFLGSELNMEAPSQAWDAFDEFDL